MEHGVAPVADEGRLVHVLVARQRRVGRRRRVLEAHDDLVGHGFAAFDDFTAVRVFESRLRVAGAEVKDALLLKATGERWQVTLVTSEGAPSLRELTEARQQVEAEALRRDPLVEAAFAAFPGAEFITEDEVAPPSRGDRQWSRNR